MACEFVRERSRLLSEEQLTPSITWGVEKPKEQPTASVILRFRNLHRKTTKSTNVTTLHTTSRHFDTTDNEYPTLLRFPLSRTDHSRCANVNSTGNVSEVLIC